MKKFSAGRRVAEETLTDCGATGLRLRYRPVPGGDGIFESDNGAAIPISAPDWDCALALLRRMNGLQTPDGRRVSALLTEDGFEPWWYSQDRLLRFYLVPLTQLIPLLEALDGAGPVTIECLPVDLDRVLRALSAAPGFPLSITPSHKKVRGSFRAALAQAGLLALSLLALVAFRLACRETVFYIVDHVSPGAREDFRFAPLYRAFARRGVRFGEYAHTLSPRQALGNLLRRGRPVFFLEAADVWARLARVSAAVPQIAADRETASHTIVERALWALSPIVLAWCAESAARQRILTRALRFQRAHRAVIFDDNRHNHELIAACRSLGIPVLGFQHGVFNQFHAGLMAYGFSGARAHAFDRYGVWSELFRERLLRASALYQAADVFVAGPIRGPEGSGGGQQAGPAGRIRVLVVSEPLARKDEVIPFLRVLLDDPMVDVYLKLRPGESDASLSAYGLPAGRVRLLRTATVYEALAQVDVAIGTYSTVLYEAALALVPILWLKTTRAYGRELTEEGLADAVGTPAQLPDALRRAVALPMAERLRRRERIWGAERISGAERLLDELEAMTRLH